MKLDLDADLNCEDDEGLNWSVLSAAIDQSKITPGAVLKAGRSGAWSWVRIEAIDNSGQVHFSQISAADAATEASA